MKAVALAQSHCCMCLFNPLEYFKGYLHLSLNQNRLGVHSSNASTLPIGQVRSDGNSCNSGVSLHMYVRSYTQFMEIICYCCFVITCNPYTVSNNQGFILLIWKNFSTTFEL